MAKPTADQMYKHLTRMQKAAVKELEETDQEDREVCIFIAGKLCVFEEFSVWYNNQIKEK